MHSFIVLCLLGVVVANPVRKIDVRGVDPVADNRLSMKNYVGSSSLALLNSIYTRSFIAYTSFYNKTLNCSNCNVDYSSLKFTNLPDCQALQASADIEEWHNNLQTQYNTLALYQFYLDPNNPTYSREIKSDMGYVNSSLPQFKTLFKIYVENRTCNSVTDPDLGSIFRPIASPSDLLELARSYHYLRQFSEFLRCFNDAYSVFHDVTLSCA